MQQSNDLLRHLPTAAFVAVDEEMTGISVAKGRSPRDLSPAQRWSELKQAPERYSIIQLGIALFHSGTAVTPTEAVPTNGSTSSSSAAAVVRDGTESLASVGRGYASVPPVHAFPVLGSGSGDGTNGSRVSSTNYTVRRYNFYMFPSSTGGWGDDDEREVVLNPSAVAFLLQHKMSFDLWSSQGVPFTTTAKAAVALKAYIVKEKALMEAANPTTTVRPTIQETVRRRVELRRSEDIDFHARAMAGLREWLDSSIQQQQQQQPVEEEGNDESDEDEGAVVNLSGASFLLPTCNSFLRRALYESIEKEYPTLELESAGNQQIRVWRLNEAEKAARNQQLRRESWEDLIGRKLGMWRIFEALRRACSGLALSRSGILFAGSYEAIDWTSVDKKEAQEEKSSSMIPLIFHNGFMDICFLLTHFHSSKLPDSYQECKNLISAHFPIVYDTKVLATECLTWGDDNNDHNAQTSNLSNLFQLVVRGPTPPQGQPLQDEIQVVPAAGRNQGDVEDQEHEAAFDAYMTGAIFLGLCKRIQQLSTSSRNFLEVISSIDSTEARLFYGRNNLYQMSMYTMDLEESRPNRDPLSRGMLPESTYRVAGIDKAVTTRDIVRCLSGINDTFGRQVNFEIVWIDDTTFLVAAIYRRNTTDEAENESYDAVEGILQDHGRLLLRALRERFQHESIIVLEDYLRSVIDTQGCGNEKEQHNDNTWIDRVLSFFGLARKRSAANGSENIKNKRHRVN